MLKQKKLMLLGGLRYLIPVIKAAKKQGYYVITADYLPNNIAHRYSDEYCNVSIIDKDAVLREAKQRNIDGIMSFACDPGVVSASYVQNKLGLPSFGPFESVEILQDKGKFRDFLAKNGFNTPKAKSFSSIEEALSELSDFTCPFIVKPVDSAGSKGVTKVSDYEEFEYAVSVALEHSISGKFIVEEFIKKKGSSSDADSMAVEGKLVITDFNSQHFDDHAINPYTPASYSWPSTYSTAQKEYLTREIQRLISLLGMQTALFNIETRIGQDGKAYIMELTPRGGGNRLSEMLRYATGVDLITACVRAAVGEQIETIEPQPNSGHWAEIILHSDRSGTFKEVQITNPDYERYVVETDLWVRPGENVEGFEGANNAIGTVVFNFHTKEMMDNAIASQHEWLKIILK